MSLSTSLSLSKPLPSTFAQRGFVVIVAAGIALSPCLLMQGCSTPSERPSAKSAALSGLSTADRQLVGRGDIHKGLSKDAVYVAWGHPSQTTVNQTARGLEECWTYVQTFNGYGGGYYGISRGLVHGRHGDHYDTDNFYPAPTDAQTLGGTPSTEVPVKRVIFENGRVISYETTQQKGQNEEAGNEG